MASAGKDYLACGNARRKGTCDSSRGVRRHLIEEAVLEALKNNLMQPDLVKVFIEEFHAEINRQTKLKTSTLADKQRQLDAVTRKLDGLYEAIADGIRTPGLLKKVEGLEARQDQLQVDLASTPPPAPVLHPNLSELYKRKVERLHETLNDPNYRTESAEVLRSIVHRINVKPTGRGSVEIDLIGEIVNMINLAQASNQKTAAPSEATVHEDYRSSVKVVAGARNRRYLHVDHASL